VLNRVELDSNFALLENLPRATSASL